MPIYLLGAVFAFSTCAVVAVAYLIPLYFALSFLDPELLAIAE